MIRWQFARLKIMCVVNLTETLVEHLIDAIQSYHGHDRERGDCRRSTQAERECITNGFGFLKHHFCSKADTATN